MSPLLDTHVWLWWLTGAGRLPPVQRRALDVFRRSLVPLGYLCLGLQEHLIEPAGWTPVDRRLQIYRRSGTP